MPRVGRICILAFVWPYHLVANKQPRHVCVLSRRRMTRVKHRKCQKLTTGVWSSSDYIPLSYLLCSSIYALLFKSRCNSHCFWSTSATSPGRLILGPMVVCVHFILDSKALYYPKKLQFSDFFFFFLRERTMCMEAETWFL